MGEEGTQIPFFYLRNPACCALLVALRRPTTRVLHRETPRLLLGEAGLGEEGRCRSLTVRYCSLRFSGILTYG